MRVWKDGNELRCGFTTGSCAAAAAKAAITMLITGNAINKITITTPKGIPYQPLVENAMIGREKASCSVKKDGGDDPDVTTGLFITAEVSWKKSEAKPSADDPYIPRIVIDGGIGVGRVTRPGLELPVGAAAINRVPRMMIEREIRMALEQFGICRDVKVIISAEGGEERAKHTFNPRLGIAGGISILGTTGVVMPMSEKAMVDTIRAEMRICIQQNGGHVLSVPGNRGEDFCREHYGIQKGNCVICSNYVGETIDAALEYQAKSLLFVGHIGKFIKLAAGIMNTHSREADARMEILAANAIWCGAPAKLALRVLNCVTTDEAAEILEREGWLKPVTERVAERMDFYLKKRAGGNLAIGMIFYSFSRGYLGETEHAAEILEKICGFSASLSADLQQVQSGCE